MVNETLEQFGLIPHVCVNIKPGDRFGRLTVIATGRPLNNYRYACVVKCDCGSPLLAMRNDTLTRGTTTGCGCVRLERTKTHGLSKHPMFSVHKCMMSRCYNPKDVAYHDYGGRGIGVCERWHDVANFHADLVHLHQPGLFIDRINNDKDYEPGNVRFTTRIVNNNNRRTVSHITFKDQTLSLKQWSRELGINYGTLRSRLEEGWSIEKTLSTPPRPKCSSI